MQQSTMHHDPWAASSEEEFDLADCFEDEGVPATPYIQHWMDHKG